MDVENAGALLLAIISSGTLATLGTHWFTRRKHLADAATVNVKTALMIEERAVQRYNTAVEALDAAQVALDTAREQIKLLQGHVLSMHRLLTDAGIFYELPAELLDTDIFEEST